MGKTIVNSLIKLIFLFSSFTVWFAFNSYLRWNIFLILLLCGVNIILYSVLPKLTLPKESYIENVLLVLLIVIITFSFGYNMIVNPHPKLLSNYIGMLIIMAVFYFYYTAAIFTYAQKGLIIRWCAYGGVVVMLIASVDGVLVNFFDIRIHDWFAFGFPGNTTYFDRAIWSSPCGPCVEPAETALFINTLFPFCLYFFKGIKKYILTGLYVFCIFELFSSVGVFTMITGALIYGFLTQSIIRMMTVFIFLSIVLVKLQPNI